MKARTSDTLPENTVITMRNGKKVIMKLNDDWIRRLENPEYEEFDIDKL